MFVKFNTFIIVFLQFYTICQTFKSKDEHAYDYRSEYLEQKLSKIYSHYLSDKSVNKNCKRNGKISEITKNDFNRALKKANNEYQELIKIDEDYLAKDPRGHNFDENIYYANLDSKYNHLLTKNLINCNCLSELEAVLNITNKSLPKYLQEFNQYCDLESDVSPTVKCNPNYKYRRIDGKCNNLENTNWGSSFHCQRRILPPHYSDGIGRPRMAINGSPLPNPRLLSKQLLKEDFTLSNHTLFNIMWGQFIAHDTFGRILYFGGNIECCSNNHSAIHPECLPIDDIPSDHLSKAYNQNCINFQRAITCNTCSLGARNYLNQMTSFLDLSHIYGLTQSSSIRLRTFRGGEMKVGKALDNSIIYPIPQLPIDQERFELKECKPTPDRPYLTCFQTGEGIRGNQNPMLATLGIIMLRRHNQHTRALATVNPHWNDERLFQEARRLLIAEYNMINFNEYLGLLSRNYLDEYSLKIKKNGFTQYDPNVDPTGILSVGGAAFRYGHTRVHSLYKVFAKYKYDSYGFKLRDKFFEMSDIWDGKTNAIIRGLTESESKWFGPNIVDDLQDHLYMDKCHPQINDLGAYNIQRGRDYGLPSYVYFLQYYTGVHIKSWNDLKRYIPVNYLRKLMTYYRDIDLYVGQLMERGTQTMAHLLGIQTYHIKYGDRFFFEHGGQSGSFTIEQLNNIRQRFSLANLLCKTTDFKSVNSKPFLMFSPTNRKVLCQNMQDINYELFRE